MKTIILNISDIHVGSETPENEGLVIGAFIKDVEQQIKSMSYDDIYVFIGGDLVFSSEVSSYEKFDKSVIQELLRVLSINRDHVILVPGNHDIKQSYIGDVKESFLPIFNEKYDERQFNDLIRKEAQHPTIFGKFDVFKDYVENTMGNKNFPLTCGYYDLNEVWSVHTLNSAILSCGGYDKIDDIGHLGVDTRQLQENLAKDSHKKKILLMHHPEYLCLDWVKHELRKLYHESFDLVLSGHTHDQETFCQKNKKFGYIHCEAPQLYTDKYDDTLGYSFIEILDEDISRIIYREWVEKKNCFRAGSAFTEEETGIESFESIHGQEDSKLNDQVSILLRSKLRKEMEAYVGQPYIWVERYLSDDRIDQIFRLTKSTMYSETDIINNQENLRVVAPSQYGLTCYGTHFLITLWEIKHDFGIKIDAENIRTRKFEHLVSSELALFNKNKEDVKWVIIDNWKPFKRDQVGISKFLLTEFPDAHFILMSPFHEHNFEDHLSATEIIPIAKTLYLTPLKHEQERLIVDEYNKNKFIDESDAVLKKMDEDIKDFNLHRTPYSCITLLTVFKDSFDRNPVNRTSVLENILNIIFDNTKLPTYSNSNPDVKDCEFCLGYFCSYIVEQENYLFKRDFFYSKIKEFCEKKETTIDINQLFDILCYNRILIEENGYYTFRFTFWVYYFVASWMLVDEDYSKSILNNQKYLHYPEVLEFYTGKDRKRKDAVETVTADLKIATANVQQKAGITEAVNPFANLRFNNDKERSEKIIREIETNVQGSNLPQSIKDLTADLSYNPSAAFHQDIYKVYSDFSVGYLVNLISISSKVLRNSDHLDASQKHDLLQVIISAWKVFANIIYLVSHMFARQGYIHLPEYGIKLTEEFNNFEPEEKRIQIIAAIPHNLMMMFKEDIFSKKLSSVYINRFIEEKDRAQKHLLATFLVYKQPEGWDTVIQSYLSSVNKDSYYLGSIKDALSENYYLGELMPSDKMKMGNLLKSVIFKATHGDMPASLGLIRDMKLIPSNSMGEDNEEENNEIESNSAAVSDSIRKDS